MLCMHWRSLCRSRCLAGFPGPQLASIQSNVVPGYVDSRIPDSYLEGFFQAVWLFLRHDVCAGRSSLWLLLFFGCRDRGKRRYLRNPGFPGEDNRLFFCFCDPAVSVAVADFAVPAEQASIDLQSRSLVWRE